MKNTSLVSLLGASLLLAACGGAQSTQPTTPVATEAPVAEAAAPAPEAAPAPVAEPAKPAPTYVHGKFVWFELITDDVAKAKEFYSQLLGWQLKDESMGDMTYTMIINGDRPIGLFATPQEKRPNQWTSYVSVPDVDAAVKVIEQTGGKVQVPAMDIPNIGRFAAVTDPQGAYFSVFKNVNGDEADREEAKQGEWVWNELWTKDPKAAVDFYSTVVGYKTESFDKVKGMTYTVLMAGERPSGGLMALPKPKLATQWVPYVAVTDVDATVKKAKELKGKVLVPPMDIPTVGRTALLTDPTGAIIGLLQPAADKGPEKAAK